MKRNHASPPSLNYASEATLNWLALGLLLAAWNAVDNDAPRASTIPAFAVKPATLAAQKFVSVRTVKHLHCFT
jgi:hypothetical protein